MSGWESDGFYGLTATQCERWCGRGLTYARMQFEKAGIEVQGVEGGRFIRVKAPDSATLYEVLTGRPSKPEAAAYQEEQRLRALRRSALEGRRGGIGEGTSPSLPGRGAAGLRWGTRKHRGSGATDRAKKQDTSGKKND